MTPTARGLTHQIAFFVALCACVVLLSKSYEESVFIANAIYSVSLVGLYSISAMYHFHLWSRETYLVLRRIDHAAIFALIAGTTTPICLLGFKSTLGFHLMITMWIVGVIGMLVTIFWSHAPKWVRSSLYVTMGWLGVPFISEIRYSLGPMNTWLLLLGGISYTIGALIYAFKRPNLFPRVFGYHELFHLFVVIGSGFHYCVIYSLTTSLSFP